MLGCKLTITVLLSSLSIIVKFIEAGQLSFYVKSEGIEMKAGAVLLNFTVKL